MKDTLLYLLTQIVDNAEALTVDESTANEQTVFTIHADPADMGKIIGKQGRIIRALRDLVKLMATKENKYVDIVIAE